MVLFHQKKEKEKFMKKPFPLLLFSFLGLWFMLEPLGIPVYGNYWSWFVLFAGLCLLGASMCCSKCPIGMPCCFGFLVTLIGAWFLLDDFGIITTFNIDLLYLMTFIIPLGFILRCYSSSKICMTSCKTPPQNK